MWMLLFKCSLYLVGLDVIRGPKFNSICVLVTCIMFLFSIVSCIFLEFCFVSCL